MVADGRLQCPIVIMMMSKIEMGKLKTASISMSFVRSTCSFPRLAGLHVLPPRVSPRNVNNLLWFSLLLVSSTASVHGAIPCGLCGADAKERERKERRRRREDEVSSTVSQGRTSQIADKRLVEPWFDGLVVWALAGPLRRSTGGGSM